MAVDPQAKNTAERACQCLHSVLKDNLRSCVLYGSAVRGNLVPGQSDINLLIILEHSTPEAHQAVAESLRSFECVSPFLLSHSELPGSQRVFALKFRSIQRHYLVLCGADPLSGFDPPPDLLRFLCEQALRNLRLRLKHAFITIGHDRRRYAARLTRSIPAIFTNLSEVLRCADIDVPDEYRNRSEVIGRTLGIDASVLNELLSLRLQPRRLSANEVFSFHSQVFRLLCRAVSWVDERWQTTKTP